jgi:uncharacterized secreted protein with C-terminal beta-propeller domain
MYENIMNKFRWGGLESKEVYMDENNIRMTMNLRSNFDRLAEALIAENKKDSAIKVLDKAFDVLPEKNVPFNFFTVKLAEGYYKAGENSKPDAILKRYADIVEQELDYYFSQKPEIYKDFDADAQRNMSILRYMIDICRRAKRTEMVDDLDKRFRRLEQVYLSNSGTVVGPSGR